MSGWSWASNRKIGHGPCIGCSPAVNGSTWRVMCGWLAASMSVSIWARMMSGPCTRCPAGLRQVQPAGLHITQERPEHLGRDDQVTAFGALGVPDPRDGPARRGAHLDALAAVGTAE